MARAMLELHGLCKRYGARRVLDDVSLRVAPGEAVALLGVNGAGKTTLLRALLDLVRLDAGSIRIAGHAHTATAARAALGYLGERFHPPAFATGSEFLRHLLALDGLAFDADRARIEADALELEAAALATPLGTWSKGMAQKLGLIACILAAKPLLVLDEPMSGLDPRARALIKARLRALNEAGTTLLFSSHLLADVDALAARVAVLHQGRLVFDGAPSRLVAEQGVASLEAAFLRVTATR